MPKIVAALHQNKPRLPMKEDSGKFDNMQDELDLHSLQIQLSEKSRN
jgi:hypothetical protein